MKTANLPPSLDDLVVFVAVAEAAGFSEAARRLGVSKSQASAAVARLEARLGLRLLHRTTRRLSLTEAGQAALPHAQQAAMAARDAGEAATALRAAPRGVLRVNAPMSFGLLHVVPALGAFARAYPEITVDLVLDDRRLDLVEGGFDLAVRIGDLPDSSLVARRLGDLVDGAAHAEFLQHAFQHLGILLEGFLVHRADALLRLPCELVLTESYAPADRQVARERIDRAIRRLRSADEEAQAERREMQAARDAADGGEAAFAALFAHCATMMQKIPALPQPVIAQVQGITQSRSHDNTPCTGSEPAPSVR